MSLKGCLRCTHYIRCKDPRKSIVFFCDRFAASRESLKQESEILSQALELPFRTSTLSSTGMLHMPNIATRDSGFDAYESLKSVLADKRIVSPDIKIPEGDFPEAPNFYTWCVSDQFLDQKPFVMQAMLGTRLFAEYCPDCSDVDWMDNGCKVNSSLGKFTRKVALLHYGKCPYCHKTKLHFFRKGTLAPYWEMALSAGQRCVIGETLVLTQDGIIEIGDYAEKRPYGFSDFGVRFQTDSTLDQTSKFYRARAEHCYVLQTKHGFSITGTSEHPVMTEDGFVRLSEVDDHDHVRVYYGQMVFGNKTVILKDVTAKTNLEFNSWRRELKPIHQSNVIKPRRKPGCGRDNLYQVDESLARLLGYWVAEGRFRNISNNDQQVLDDCYNTLSKMFGNQVIRRTVSSIEFSNTYVQMWLANLMQVDITRKSALKEVPRCILQASKDVQVAFLSALFEGDGCVSTRLIRGKAAYSVGYASISKKLIDQLSVMLLNLGILHQRRTRKTWATNGSSSQVEKDCFSLSIRGPNIVEFSKHIGFQSQRKKQLLIEAVEYVSTKINNVPFYFDKLTHNQCEKFYRCLEYVRDELGQLASPGSRHAVGLQSVFGVGHRQFTRADRQRTLTKSDVDRFILPLLSEDFCFSSKTRSLLLELAEYGSECNYYYEPVVSVHKTAEKYETFDVTVPGKHRFISNGMLSHNSGKSALFGMLASYLTHRMIKLERPNEVFGLLKANVLQGTFVALTHAQAKDTLWEPFYGHLLEAPWFCIAEDTEVSLANGTTKAIQDIEIGDLVETLDGSDVVTNVFDNGVKECLAVTLCDGNVLPGTAEHQVRCLSDDGESLVWKDISSLTEDDYVVSQNAG